MGWLPSPWGKGSYADTLSLRWGKVQGGAGWLNRLWGWKAKSLFAQRALGLKFTSCMG